jgi:outer membrane immunogenic protein
LRAGYAVDRALFFITGGLAYGSGNDGGGYVAYWAQPRTVTVGLNNITAPVGAPAAYYTSNNSSSRVGWTLGGGVEYAVTNNWTIKLEYLYANLGNGRNSLYGPRSYVCSSFCSALTIPTSAGATIALPGNQYFSSAKNGNNINIARAGLNYKF